MIARVQVLLLLLINQIGSFGQAQEQGLAAECFAAARANMEALSRFDLLYSCEQLNEPLPNQEAQFLSSTVWSRLRFDFKESKFFLARRGERDTLTGTNKELLVDGFVWTNNKGFSRTFPGTTVESITSRDKLFDFHEVPDLRVVGTGSLRGRRHWETEIFKEHEAYATNLPGRKAERSDGFITVTQSFERKGFEPSISDLKYMFICRFDESNFTIVEAKGVNVGKKNGASFREDIFHESIVWREFNGLFLPVRISREDMLFHLIENRKRHSQNISLDYRFYWISVGKEFGEGVFALSTLNDDAKLSTMTDVNEVRKIVSYTP